MDIKIFYNDINQPFKKNWIWTWVIALPDDEAVAAELVINFLYPGSFQPLLGLL